MIWFCLWRHFESLPSPYTTSMSNKICWTIIIFPFYFFCFFFLVGLCSLHRFAARSSVFLPWHSFCLWKLWNCRREKSTLGTHYTHGARYFSNDFEFHFLLHSTIYNAFYRRTGRAAETAAAATTENVEHIGLQRMHWPVCDRLGKCQCALSAYVCCHYLCYYGAFSSCSFFNRLFTVCPRSLSPSISTIQKSNPFLSLNLSQFFFNAFHIRACLRLFPSPCVCVCMWTLRAESAILFSICLSGNFIETISFAENSLRNMTLYRCF